MNKVYTVRVVKDLIVQASCIADAQDKAESMSDSDSSVLHANKINFDSSLPNGLTLDDEPDNSIGLTIKDILNGQ